MSSRQQSYDAHELSIGYSCDIRTNKRMKLFRRYEKQGKRNL